MTSSRAIVIGTENFGEADRYVIFFTKNWGLISTLAKSARKSKRRYVGGLDLFCHSEIFIKGDPKERPYLQELSVLNSFPGLREELEKMLAAGRTTQWVKKLANTSVPMPGVYSLLGQTLSLIEKEKDPSRYELLCLIFKLKLLSEVGLKPKVDTCTRCSEPIEDKAVFDMDSGGVLCKKCAPKSSLHESLLLPPNERVFLDVADRLRLTAWEDIHLDPERVFPLQRLVTQFASFHTHTHLPV
jgi:DNA repair protein RecO (recombination protein O)